MTETPRLRGLSIAEARAIVGRVLEAGAAHGFAPLTAAVVDVMGSVQALNRSDGASPLTSDIAIAKARTALTGMMPTSVVEKLPEGILAAARGLYGGNFVSRAGGVLITREGEVLGALGVSGAASEEDEEAALRALDGWRGADAS